MFTPLTSKWIDIMFVFLLPLVFIDFCVAAPGFVHSFSPGLFTPPKVPEELVLYVAVASIVLSFIVVIVAYLMMHAAHGQTCYLCDCPGDLHQWRMPNGILPRFCHDECALGGSHLCQHLLDAHGVPTPAATDAQFPRHTLRRELIYLDATGPPKNRQEKSSIMNLKMINEQEFRNGNNTNIRINRGVDGARHDVGLCNNTSCQHTGDWSSTCPDVFLGVDWKTDFGLQNDGTPRATGDRSVQNLGNPNSIDDRRPYVFHLISATSVAVFICLLGADVRAMMTNSNSMSFSAHQMFHLAANNAVNYNHAHGGSTQIQNRSELEVLQWLQLQYHNEAQVQPPAHSLMQDFFQVNLPASDDCKIGFVSLLNIYENVLKYLGWGIVWSGLDGSGFDFCLVKPGIGGAPGPAVNPATRCVDAYSQHSLRGVVHRVEGKSFNYQRHSYPSGFIHNRWQADFGFNVSSDDFDYALIVHQPVDRQGVACLGPRHNHDFTNAHPDQLAQHTTTNRYIYYLPMKVLLANGGAFMKTHDDHHGRAWVWPNELAHPRTGLYPPPVPFMGQVVPWNALAHLFIAPQDHIRYWNHPEPEMRTGWAGQPDPTFKLVLTRQATDETRVECTHQNVMGSRVPSDYPTCDFIDDYCFDTCDNAVFGGGNGEWQGVRPAVPTIATPFVEDPNLVTNAPTTAADYNPGNYIPVPGIGSIYRIPRVGDMGMGMHIV